jgi:glyoxylase-like metal-dependent hydrolase (beta-lactamase superfamily II)
MSRPREVDGFPGLRVLRADNPSPLTLDGTRTHILGRERCIVLDPGPDHPEHISALDAALGEAEAVTIALTHDHPDHAAGAPALVERLARRGVEAQSRGVADGTLEEADTLDADAGRLVVLATPGHTRDHVAFHWPGAAAIFCGDLMMGGLDTALVAPPEGHLGDYLASLDRMAALRPRAIFPAHGPPFTTSPEGAIATYREHRRKRLEQVRAAKAEGMADAEDIVSHVYGEGLPSALRAAAAAAVHAYLDYLEETAEA